MSEFWLVTNTEQDWCKVVSSVGLAVDNLNVLSQDGRTYLIYHFVNGIPHDVTPGRHNAITLERKSHEEMILDLQIQAGKAAHRLAKIEARLDGLEQVEA